MEHHYLTMKAALRRLPLVLLGIGIGFAGLLALQRWQQMTRPPDDVALAYARAVYARDYATAWEFISAGDKEMKSREAYLAENVSYAGLKQELAYTLAGWLQFTETEIEIGDDRAAVTTRYRAPNGNQRQVYDILQAAGREKERSDDEGEALFQRLEAMYAAGEIEILEGEQTFELIREWTGWHIIMGWDETVVVRLTAEVSPELPWEFYPLQEEVRALPGEFLVATYRATNLSDRTSTGKARHFVLPEAYEPHFDTVQCFCFIQQTLDPGESVDLTLSFRIGYEVPQEVRQIENKYIFYPLESFPED